MRIALLEHPTGASFESVAEAIDAAAPALAEAEALAGEGVEVHLFIEGPPGRESSRGVELHLGAPSVRAALAERPRVVHLSRLVAARFLTDAALAGSSVPILAEHDGSAPPSGRVARRLLRAASEALSAAFFVSAELAAPLVSGGALSPRLRVLEVPATTSGLRARPKAEGPRRLIVSGPLSPASDPMTALSAFLHVLDAHPDARLTWLAAPGRASDETRRRIGEEPRLRASVDMIFEQEPSRVEAAYAAARVALVTPFRDAFGLGLVEALATGTPAAATNISVHRRYESPAVALCPIGDARALADAALSLMDRGGAPREVFERLASPQAIARARIAAYERVVR